MRAALAIAAEDDRRDTRGARGVHGEVGAVAADAAFVEDLGEGVALIRLLHFAGHGLLHVVLHHLVRGAPVFLLEVHFFQRPIQLRNRHGRADDIDEIGGGQAVDVRGEVAFFVVLFVKVVALAGGDLQALAVPVGGEGFVENEGAGEGEFAVFRAGLGVFGGEERPDVERLARVVLGLEAEEQGFHRLGRGEKPLRELVVRGVGGERGEGAARELAEHAALHERLGKKRVAEEAVVIGGGAEAGGFFQLGGERAIEEIAVVGPFAGAERGVERGLRALEILGFFAGGFIKHERLGESGGDRSGRGGECGARGFVVRGGFLGEHRLGCRCRGRRSKRGSGFAGDGCRSGRAVFFRGHTFRDRRHGPWVQPVPGKSADAAEDRKPEENLEEVPPLFHPHRHRGAHDDGTPDGFGAWRRNGRLGSMRVHRKSGRERQKLSEPARPGKPAFASRAEGSTG